MKLLVTKSLTINSHFKDAQTSKYVPSDSMKLNIGKSTIVEEESTTPVDKANIPREWIHNANYPENYILVKPDEKMQTRSSLRKEASVVIISQSEQKMHK